MTETTPRSSLASTVALAGRLVAEADPGVQAELRRLDPGREDNWQSGAFYRLMAVLEPERTLGASGERAWAALLSGMARIEHVPDGPKPGALLAGQGFSELRFARLLEADESQLHVQLRSAVHYLSSKGTSRMDWLPLAQLMLDRRGHDRTRRNLARDYYRASVSAEER